MFSGNESKLLPLVTWVKTVQQNLGLSYFSSISECK